MTEVRFGRLLAACRHEAIAVPLLVLAGLPSLADAQSVPGSRVLVMPFAAEVEAQAPGGAATSLWIGEAASILLGENLAGLGVGTISREERLAASERLQLPMSSALTRATMIRVGELIGASEIVFGEVRLGQTLHVRARLIRVNAGQERPSVEESAPLSDIFALFSRLADHVATATGRIRPAATVSPAPLSLETFELYVKGLVAATPAAQQRFLESAIRLAPTDARILLALWDVYVTQDVHDKALAVANAVPADSRSARAARFAVAQSLIALRRFDGAFQELTALHAKEPAAAISNAIGIVQLRRGAAAGTSPATTYFARAVSEEPNNTSYLFNLGYAHALVPNASEALAWLRETVRFDAADGDAHLVMSALLASTGRAAEAQRELDLARSLGTTVDASAQGAGSRVPANLERLEPALSGGAVVRLTTVTPAQRDQKETAAYHLARGRTLVDARKDREAIEELRRAIYLAPYEDEPHLLLGRVYHRTGRTAEAIDEFKVALWSRETAAAHIALGAALLDAGERDAARQAAERALVLSPASVEARELLKKIGG
jgi:tetratricopeptide (TPR) repeat protein